jgi:AraC-like DNA-binding protein
MKLRFTFTRRMSIFLSSLLAYVIILSVPIFIGFGIYSQSLQIIENEVQRANDAILSQVQQSFDSRLREIEQLSVQIAMDSRIKSLLSVRADVQVTHRYTMYGIINDFRAYIFANPFINSFYVYLKNSDIAVASNASYDSRTLVSTWLGEGEGTYDDWRRFIDSVHGNRYLLQDRITADKNTVKMLSYVSPLPIGSSKNPSAVLTIYLNEATLREVVGNIRMVHEGTVMVMDSEGQILFSTEPYALPDTLDYQTLSAGTGTIEETIDGKDVVISHINSSVADWVYVTVVPVEVFMQEALNARRLAIVSFAACILLGGLLVFVFIRANYNPVRELVGMITRRSGVSRHKGLNEYRFIEDVVTNIIDEKESIQRRLDQQDLNLRNYHFARVLKGNADNIPFESTCQYYRLDFTSDYFSVLLFYLEGYDKLQWEDDDAATRTVLNVLRAAVEELVSRCGHTGIMVEVDDFYACLVNMADGGDRKRELMAIAEEAMRAAGETMGLSVSVAASGPMRGFSCIPLLYQQSMEAIEYLQLIGSRRMLHYDEIRARQGEPMPNKTFVAEEQRFVNCLKAGDYETAKQLFNDLIVGNYLSDPAVPIDLVKCRMFGLVNTTINTLGEISVLYESHYFKKERPIERLLNCHSMQELQQCFNALLDEVEKLDAGKRVEDPGLVDRVKEFIHTDYQDVNLNVTMLADRFGATTAGLSKLFKKRTGMGLLDYIHRCRLDHAKQLLKNRQVHIRDISRLSGFIDSDAFIRVFKKYEGVTPGKYREIEAGFAGKK